MQTPTVNPELSHAHNENPRSGGLTQWRSQYAHFPDKEAAVAAVVEQGLPPTQQNVAVMHEQMARNAAPETSARPTAPGVRMNQDPTQVMQNSPPEDVASGSMWDWLMAPAAAVGAGATRVAAAPGTELAPTGAYAVGPAAAPQDDTRVVGVNPPRTDNALPAPDNSARAIDTEEVVPNNRMTDLTGVRDVDYEEVRNAAASGNLVATGTGPNGSTVYTDQTTGKTYAQINNRWVTDDAQDAARAVLKKALRSGI